MELFGRVVPFQLADLNIGILWILAMTSIGVYGVVLAGWSSGSNYPLLGAMRSSAQMISYEVGMGLALVAVIMYSGHLSMSEIVAPQGHSRSTGTTPPSSVPAWNIFPQFPAFVVFLICALAETNRPPFDLAEAESELVAGFHTEYSGIKFAMFFLGEYVNTVTVAAVAVTFFLGGWRGYWPFHGAAVVGRPAAVVHPEDHRGDLRDDPGARHAAADALRPADALRLEGADPVRPGVGDGHRRSWCVLPTDYGSRRSS